MTSRRARASCALLLLGALSCEAPGEDGSAGAGEGTTSPLVAAPTARATLVMEPAVLAIGGVADLEIALVTPPDQRMLPIKVPSLQGLWLLENEQLPVERDSGRWIHRSRLRVRAREVGSFRWPALSVGIEDAKGEIRQLALEERAFEVVSVVSELPGRLEPFGLQRPDRGAEGLRAWIWAVCGAGLVLAGLASATLARRGWRRRRARGGKGDTASLEPWDWARQELAAAEGRLDADPRGAATAAASMLRGYLDRRYGTDVRAATTAELDCGEPLWFLRSQWRDVLSILHALDAERFRSPEPLGADSVRRIREALAHANRFVSESGFGGEAT